MSRDRWSDHPCEPLSALVDGELPSGERRAAVEAHLGACPACRALKEDIELLRQAVAAEAPPPMPGDLAARIRGRIKESAPAPRAGWWRMPWGVPMPAVAAAAVVVVALAWLAWPPPLHSPGAPIPATEIAARVAPGGSDPAGGPKAAGGPDAAGAPRTSAPASAPEPARAQAPASAPAPIVGSSATAPEKPEPKIARSTPAGDAAAGRSNQAPPVARRDDGAPLTPADAIARNDGARLYKEAVKDAERGRAQGGFLEATARQESPAKSAAVEARPGLAMSDVPITSPPLEADPYVVRLLPDGSMSVRMRDYQCAVPIAPDDARLLATMGEAATAGVATRSPAPGPAATGAMAPATMSEPLPVILSPEARSAIVRLVRQRYRAIIEERCGPLPR